MNSNLYKYFYQNLDNIHTEHDRAVSIRNSVCIDEKIGIKVAFCTREKIFRELVAIFKDIRLITKGRYDLIENLKARTPALMKRIKLHLKQIRQLKQNFEDNKTYFHDIIKVIYEVILKLGVRRQMKM